MASKPPYQVVVLEDNALILERFCNVLQQWPDAQAVHPCLTLHEAQSVFARHSVDLLVTDLVLPDGDGVNAITECLTAHPEAQAIVISALSSRRQVLDSFRAGAVGYILKDEEDYSILEICDHIMQGKSIMSPSIARMMLTELTQSSVMSPAPSDNPLTAKETEILSLIGKGYAYKEVAQLKDISVGTVQVHIRHIYKKLQVNNRSEAFYEAKKMGLIDD